MAAHSGCQGRQAGGEIIAEWGDDLQGHVAGALDAPDEATELLRNLVSRRAMVVQGMTRTKNRIHAVLHANLIPPFSGKLFLRPGRKWLAEQPLSVHERAAVDRWLAGLDAMEQELATAEAAIATACLGDARVRRLMTIGGINMSWPLVRKGELTLAVLIDRAGLPVVDCASTSQPNSRAWRSTFEAQSWKHSSAASADGCVSVIAQAP